VRGGCVRVRVRVQDLVSHSGDSGSSVSEDDGAEHDDADDDDEDRDDDDAPQAPAPDDGEGSDFDELQARRLAAATRHTARTAHGSHTPRTRPNPACVVAQVEFEFFDLKPVDFHGLRALFQRYMDGELPFALSELVEALIEQARLRVFCARSLPALCSLRWRRPPAAVSRGARRTRWALWSRPTATWIRWV
jgi:hypothetical protein